MVYRGRDQFLKEQGLYAVDTVGDGNCLFSALSEQLYGVRDRHAEIRQKVCDHQQANADELSGFLEGSQDRLAVFLDRIENMRELGTWGGEFEICCFATAYGVKVKCWSRPKAKEAEVPRFIEYGDDNAARTVFVCFDRETSHYETLRNLEGPHEGLPDCFHLAAAQKEREESARGADEVSSPAKSCGSKRSSSERGDDDDGSDKDEPAGKRSKLSPSPAPAPGQAVKESASNTTTTADATTQRSTGTISSSSAVQKSAAVPAATSSAPTVPAAIDEKVVSTAAEVGRPSRSSSSSSKRSFSRRGDDGDEGDVEERPAKSPKLSTADTTAKDSGPPAPIKKAVSALTEDSEGDSDVDLGALERAQIARAMKRRVERKSEAAKVKKTAGLKKAVGAKAKPAAVGQSKGKASTVSASIAATAAARPETKSRVVAPSDHKVKVSGEERSARASKPAPASTPRVGTTTGAPKTWEERREADRLAKEHVRALLAKREAEKEKREEEERRKKAIAGDKGRKDAGAGKAAGLSKEKTMPKPRRRK